MIITKIYMYCQHHAHCALRHLTSYLLALDVDINFSFNNYYNNIINKDHHSKLHTLWLHVTNHS